MKKFGVFLMLFLIAIFAFTATAAEEEIKKNFDVKAGQLFTLKADFGAVNVNSWGKNDVQVVVRKETNRRSDKEAKELFEYYEVDFRQDSRGVTVIAEYTGPKNWFGRSHDMRVHFNVTVPREFDLDVNTSGGSIEVSDIEGHVDVNTSGGYIKLGSIGGKVDAKTSGGSISLRGSEGTALLKSSGGSIDIGNVDGDVTAKTSGGTISVDGAKGNADVSTSGGGLNLANIRGNVNGSTSGGSITAELLGKLDRDCTLKTSGGGINVYLNKNIEVTIDARTSGGHVSCDFPVTVQGKIKKSQLFGKINGGGPTLTLKTSGGSIRIKEM
ncbi:DUF4097 family beta strand repeat protein [candidate division KSB1 bacterium]|nr:DUF4097 family beta strand repeat protein [candidate division KSB1 bacterium]